MKIYDISQEVFTCSVFPGDAEPQKEILLKVSDGDVCNLSALHMCAHNGTHVDAPYHFLDQGKKIDEIDLSKFIGQAYVAEHEGVVSAQDANDILEKAVVILNNIGLTLEDGINLFLDDGNLGIAISFFLFVFDNCFLIKSAYFKGVTL